MLFPFVSMLTFLWSSTNQHGVHSPFVFNYLTQGLYKKTGGQRKKIESVLLKSIPYFNIKTIHIHPKEPVKALVKEHHPDLVSNEPPYDLIFMDIAKWPKFYESGKNAIHNSTLIVLSGLYQNRLKYNLWKELIKMPEFNVSIDMFYCGVLFIRKEQRKEHFKVRI